MSADIVLASTSPYRRALMEQAGYPFRARSPGVDEDALKALGLSPHELAERLAIAKADALRDAEPGAILIGCDQVAAIDGEVLDKPGTADRAAAQLRKLSGRTHHLITALAVRHGDELRTHTDVTALTMRELTDDEIAAYLDADHPFDCAGSYKYEGAGAGLFSEVITEDPSAIVGLPMKALGAILAVWSG